MPRQTRKARLKKLQPLPEKPVVKTIMPRAGNEYRQITCPCCGVGHSIAFWQRAGEFPPQDHFGVIQQVAGRGSFATLGQLAPEDEPETAEIIKNRIQAAQKYFEGV